jgi:hypothetical protein
MRESLETIVKSSIQKGIASLKKLSTEVDDENVMSAATAFMSCKQFWNEEEMYTGQRASALTIKLKASGKDVRKILNASSECNGKRA